MTCTQYVVVPPDTPQPLLDAACADLDHVDLTPFTEISRGGLGYSVRQAVAPPFSLLRMQVGG